jgi:hypothetical protein
MHLLKLCLRYRMQVPTAQHLFGVICMIFNPLLSTRALRSAAMVAASLWLAGCASTMNTHPNQAPADKGVWFVEPMDGATVGQTFKVKFGVKGMAIDPAGEQKEGKGHHHVLVNLMGKPAGELIPVDEQHIHFGKAQTEADLKLAPGQYKLTMQFADGYHLSYGPQMAATIMVNVK